MIGIMKRFITNEKRKWNDNTPTTMMMWMDYEFEQQKKRDERRKQMEQHETTVEKQCQQFVEDIQRMKADLHTLMQAYERSVEQEKQLRTQDANINEQHKTVQ